MSISQYKNKTTHFRRTEDKVKLEVNQLFKKLLVNFPT